jgi:hypothetical protein
MDPSPCDRRAGLALSREQRWVVHAAVLDAVERAVGAADDPDVDSEMALLRAVEDGPLALTAEELAVLRAALTEYLDDPPPRDREAARRTLEAVEGLLG